MGYESTFIYDFSPDIEIKNIEELNENIAKLDGGMGESKIIESKSDDITYYDIEPDYSYGKFYDSEDFAELLSKYVVKGFADLKWIGEDGGVEAIRVSPNKTEEIECIYTPSSIADDVRKYINELLKTKNK